MALSLFPSDRIFLHIGSLRLLQKPTFLDLQLAKEWGIPSGPRIVCRWTCIKEKLFSQFKKHLLENNWIIYKATAARTHRIETVAHISDTLDSMCLDLTLKTLIFSMADCEINLSSVLIALFLLIASIQPYHFWHSFCPSTCRRCSWPQLCIVL